MSDPEDKLPEEQNSASSAEDAPKAVKRGGSTVALIIVLSLVWYLAADRYTPYTNQARVQGYVVGIAPQVSGTVIEVKVQNNEEIQEDQVLFRIDPTQYDIALARAKSDYENALRQVDAGDANVEAARANLRSARFQCGVWKYPAPPLTSPEPR